MLCLIAVWISLAFHYVSALHADSAQCQYYHDYCVVGAGPGGLQMAYFLEAAGRNYIVLEKADRPGSFFVQYPRHRKLISINKRHTGKMNDEFNFRHDWNSLLSHRPELRMTRYSREMFPHADVLVRYLKDFQERLSIKVQYNTEVRGIRQVVNSSLPEGRASVMEDQHGRCYTCRTLILATGVSVPKQVNMTGIEMAEQYATASIDPEDYEGKSVLILGRGNSAFELADGIFGSSSYVHMIARSRIRMAWATHYVGDLRAINNGILDTYQLKSLDAQAEGDLDRTVLRRQGDKLHLEDVEAETFDPTLDNDALREGYDVVVSCLGFIYDHGIFNQTDAETWSTKRFLFPKYPGMTHNYESTEHPGIFYAGTSAHVLDFRQSAGGFIHGFRYTARALHHLLEWRYEKVPWPSFVVPASQLLNNLLKRMNEAAGLYQMFHFLGDVVLFSKDLQKVKYLQEYPVRLLHDLTLRTGHPVDGPVLVMVLQYGRNFSGPDQDVFRTNRATLDPSRAIHSNFLHPVLYFYRNLPNGEEMAQLADKEVLPRPDALHALPEDFLTEWTAAHSHVLPLRRFLENMLQTDLRQFKATSCFSIGLTMTSLPETCMKGFFQGQGLAASKISHQLDQNKPTYFGGLEVKVAASQSGGAGFEPGPCQT